MLTILLGQTLWSAAHAAPTEAAVDNSDPMGDEIVVTANRTAQRVSDVPQSVSVVSAATIADTPAQTLDDVLRTVPGVNLPFANVQQEHPTSNKVSMRGLGPGRALVLLDGIPINDAFFGYIAWNRVPLENVEQVEIVRGGDSTLWGDHAMGGVINIITRVPTHNELAFNIGGGSFGTYRANLYGAYVVSDAAVFSLDYGYTRSQGYQQYPDDARLTVSRATKSTGYNVNLNGDFKPWDGMTAGIRASFNDFDQSPLNELVSTNHQQIWNFSAHAKQEFDHDMALSFTAFRSSSFFATANAGTPDGVEHGEAEYIQNLHMSASTDFGGSLVLSQAVRSWLDSYSVGVDLHHIVGSDRANVFDDVADVTSYLRTDVGEGTQVFLGGFAQATLKPVTDLTVDLAARYQNYENKNGYDGVPGGIGNVPTSSVNSFDPRVSVKYALTANFDVRAAAYKAFNAPTLDSLYRTYSTLTGIFHSSPTLTPEGLKGAEIGFDTHVGPVSAQVTGYYNKITNIITSRSLTDAELPTGFFFGSQNINAATGISKGFETALQWKIMTGLSTTLSYTYADSVVTSNPYDLPSIGQQISDVPKNSLAAQVTYTAPSKWRVEADGRYLSTTYGDNDHTLVLPSHFVADISSAYPITDKLETYVQVQNLFNRYYISGNDGGSPRQYAMPLNVFVGVRGKFQ